jgi:hypothetical protein
MLTLAVRGRLFGNPIPEASEALVANPFNLLQRQCVDRSQSAQRSRSGHLPQMAQSSDSILLNFAVSTTGVKLYKSP